MPGKPKFNSLTEVYDAMVDWPARLAREAGIFRTLFDKLCAKRILDAACGTGRHAAMFHSWGLEVEGADISPEMIACARAEFGEPAGLRWHIRGFTEPAAAPGAFDAVICTGNSLALAENKEACILALRQFLNAVRSGGAVLVQVLNFYRLPDGPTVWQKCLRRQIGGEEMFIFKGVRRAANSGFVEVVAAPLSAPEQMQSESVPLLTIEAQDLQTAAMAGGAQHFEIFGSLDGQPFNRSASTDLVLLAWK